MRAAKQTIPKRLEPWIVAGGICVLLPFLIAGWMRGRNGQIDGQHHLTPSLVCDQSEHDFGTVSLPEAAALSHRFTITNVTDHDVNIVKVIQSCGCTKATPSTNVMHRGETATVTTVANWSDRSGRQSATVWVTTDEPSASTATLNIEGNVVAPVVVSPRELNFSGLDPGPSPEQYFEVSKVAGQAPVTITSVYTSGPNVRIRRVYPAGASAIEGPPGKFGVLVVAPTFRSDSFGFVAVLTSVGESQIVGLHIGSKGAIVASPESLYFDSRSHDSGTATIKVHVCPGADLHELRTELLTGGDDARFVADPPIIDAIPDHRSASIAVRPIGTPIRTTSQTLRFHCGAYLLDVPIAAIGTGG